MKQLKGHLRTLKLGLERNIGKKLPEFHPLFTWLVEHAAWLLTTRKAGDDGQSAYQRMRGRPFGKKLVEFGERVLYKLHMRDPTTTAAGRWRRDGSAGSCWASRSTRTNIRYGLDQRWLVQEQ